MHSERNIRLNANPSLPFQNIKIYGRFGSKFEGLFMHMITGNINIVARGLIVVNSIKCLTIFALIIFSGFSQISPALSDCPKQMGAENQSLPLNLGETLRQVRDDLFEENRKDIAFFGYKPIGSIISLNEKLYEVRGIFGFGGEGTVYYVYRDNKYFALKVISQFQYFESIRRLLSEHRAQKLPSTEILDYEQDKSVSDFLPREHKILFSETQTVAIETALKSPRLNEEQRQFLRVKAEDFNEDNGIEVLDKNLAINFLTGQILIIDVE